jgi:UDP-glucose 4-epimerase
MNILLTGGTGYIVIHTSVVLSELGHKVVLYENPSNSSDKVVEKLAQIIGQPIPFNRGDVRDTELLRGHPFPTLSPQ